MALRIMVDFVNKNSKEIPRISGSENSEEIDLNVKEVSAETTSDDNTICTRGTESSIIAILKNSKKEHFFDARIKSFANRQSFIGKEGKMKFGVGLRPSISAGCLRNKYKALRIFVVILGILFLFVSVAGIFFLMILPKIAEVQIRNSRMDILEIDVLQISRHSGGETSFEVNSLLEIERDSKYKAEFIHSLLHISYGLEGQEKRLLGDLYISQIQDKQDGTMSARGRFTLKNKEAVNSILKEVASTISDGISGEVSNKKITFYGKGLMSIKIFGILLNNINVEKSVSSFSIGNLFKGKDDSNEARKEPLEDSSSRRIPFSQNGGFKPKEIWLTREIEGAPLRLNLRLELDLENFLGRQGHYFFHMGIRVGGRLRHPGVRVPRLLFIC